MAEFRPEIFRIYTAYGDKYVLEWPMGILSLTGIGMPRFDHRTVRSPEQDGESYVNSVAQKRSFELSAQLAAPTPGAEGVWRRRRELMDALNPDVGPFTFEIGFAEGTLYQLRNVVFDAGFDRAFDVQGSPRTQRIAIRLLALDPIWYGAAHSETATAPGVGAWNPTLVCSNNGNRRDWPQIVLTGPMTTAVLEVQETGARIGLAAAIPALDTVTINLPFGDRYLRDGAGDLVDTDNATTLSLFDYRADPLVANGLNTLELTATACTGASTLATTWNDRILGV